MKLDKDLVIPKVKNAIEETWSYIAGDCHAMSEECGEIINNSGAMELVLDADRIREPEAKKLLNDLYAEHGYPKVMKFLCKHINLE